MYMQLKPSECRQITTMLKRSQKNLDYVAKSCNFSSMTFFENLINGLPKKPIRKDQINDYLGGVYCQTIPFLKRSGADAVSPDGELCEIKLSYVVLDNYVVEKKQDGTSRIITKHVKPSQKKKIEHTVTAKYSDMMNNHSSKRLTTYFVLYSNDFEQYISAWKIDGDTAFRLLNNRTGNVRITLNQFMTNGVEIINHSVPSLGWEGFYNKAMQFLPHIN